MRDEISDLVAKDCQDSKLQTMLSKQTDQLKTTKQQVKQLEIELS